MAQRHIHIGMLIANSVQEIDSFMGFKTSAGALTYGMERAMKEGILSDTNFT